MNKLHKAEIYDCGANKPQSLWRRVKVPGSVESVIEKPPAGNHTKYVDARGSVKFIKLTTAAALREDIQYERNIRRQMVSGGGIDYCSCPLRSEDSNLEESDFPEGLQQPCKSKDANGRPMYGYHGCCPHVEHIISTRQATAAKVDEERNEKRDRAERMEKKKFDAQVEQNDLLRQIVLKDSGKGSGKHNR